MNGFLTNLYPPQLVCNQWQDRKAMFVQDSSAAQESCIFVHFRFDKFMKSEADGFRRERIVGFKINYVAYL